MPKQTIQNFFLLFCFSFFVSTTLCVQYMCNNNYEPVNYQGRTRVPLGCELAALNCPNSWKPGLTNGESAALPLIDTNFVLCHEGFLICGYVPIDPSTGKVLGMSGVTIGGGVDLGSKNREYFVNIGIADSVIDKLEPYFGLEQDFAACAIIELNLLLTSEEALQVTEAVENLIVTDIESRYNSDRGTDTLDFRSLPRGIRTAVADVWFQFGFPSAYPKFWNFVTKNDWEGAVNELRNFYTNPDAQQTGDLIRRNDEADILEASLVKCYRSADIVFLLDESGSIHYTDYVLALNFIRNIIGAFPDETLADPRGTRFGLSIFSSNYRIRFILSSYQNQDGYENALNNVTQARQGTQLGTALDEIRLTQFIEERGLRPESYGLPKILIVLTDGVSGDEVDMPAATLKAENIVIYAIGIGGYNLEQLESMASSDSHVFLLDAFSDLQDFVGLLTASTCYQPQPISIGVTINGEVEINVFQYYEYIVEVTFNLRLTCTDTNGNTLLFVSRTNPHPYEYDNDFGFTNPQPEKEIVISAASQNITTPIFRRRRAVNETITTIYVSVKGTSGDNIAFNLVGMVCDPAVCVEGTNEVSEGIQLHASISLVLLITVSLLLFVS